MNQKKIMRSFLEIPKKYDSWPSKWPKKPVRLSVQAGSGLGHRRCLQHTTVGIMPSSLFVSLKKKYVSLSSFSFSFSYISSFFLFLYFFFFFFLFFLFIPSFFLKNIKISKSNCAIFLTPSK